MFKILDWEIKVDDELTPKITLYQNSNTIIAIPNESIVATIWEIYDGSPRVEVSNIAVVVKEKNILFI